MVYRISSSVCMGRRNKKSTSPHRASKSSFHTGVQMRLRGDPRDCGFKTGLGVGPVRGWINAEGEGV